MADMTPKSSKKLNGTFYNENKENIGACGFSPQPSTSKNLFGTRNQFFRNSVCLSSFSSLQSTNVDACEPEDVPSQPSVAQCSQRRTVNGDVSSRSNKTFSKTGECLIRSVSQYDVRTITSDDFFCVDDPMMPTNTYIEDDSQFSERRVTFTAAVNVSNRTYNVAAGSEKTNAKEFEEIMNTTFTRIDKEEEDEYQNVPNEGGTLEYLRLKAIKYREAKVLLETTSMLKICLKSKEHKATKWQVLIERYLLKGFLKIMNLNRLTNFGSIQRMCPPKCVADYHIGGLKFFINSSELDTDKYTYYFLGALHHKEQVFLTDVMVLGVEEYIHFNEIFIFKNVEADFMVKIELYYLKIPINQTLFEKYIKINDNMALSKLSERPTFLVKLKNSANVASSAYFPYSALKSCASSTIGMNNHELKKHKNIIQLERNIYVSSIEIPIKSVECLRYFVEREGYVFLSCSTGLTWLRAWCVLSQGKLLFYRRKEVVNNQNPVHEINLCRIVPPKVERIDVNICDKPNTLLLKVYKPAGSGRYKYSSVYFHVPEKDALEKWKKAINFVVESLIQWNITPEQA